MRKLSRLFVCAFVLLAFVGTATAGDKSKKKNERETHDTLISSVSLTSISITQGKTEKTVAITPSTEIYVRGQKADAAALQTGMAVSITLAMDGTKASRINAGDPPVHREIKKVKVPRGFLK